MGRKKEPPKDRKSKDSSSSDLGDQQRKKEHEQQQQQQPGAPLANEGAPSLGKPLFHGLNMVAFLKTSCNLGLVHLPYRQ